LQIRNEHERRGNALFDQKKYEAAAKSFRKALKVGPTPTAYVYIGLDVSIGLIRTALSKKNRELNDRLAEEQLAVLRSGVIAYPKDHRIWCNLAYTYLWLEKHTEFFEAARRYLELTDYIDKDAVDHVFSAIFLMGDIEMCQIAIPIYLDSRGNNPYRTIETHGNPLAEILAAFGHTICSERIMCEMLWDWCADGYWLTEPDNREHVRETCYVALFRREDVREWAISLPSFGCPYLDKVATVLKVIAQYTNGDLAAVKELLRDGIPKENAEQGMYHWLSDMAEEIAVEESEQERFDPDFLVWVPDLKSNEELAREQDATQRENDNNYEDFLLAIISQRYEEASMIRDTVRLMAKDKSQECSDADKQAWDSIDACIAKGQIAGAINILYARIRKEAGKGIFPPCAERDVLFALLYSQGKLTEARAVIAESDENHPLHREIEIALAFEAPKEEAQAIALCLPQDRAMENFGELQAYLRQYPISNRS